MVSFSTALLVAAASALLANAQSSSVNCVYARFASLSYVSSAILLTFGFSPPLFPHSWSNNGDGQNPCQIWAELGSRCGTFSVEPLTPVGADGLSSSYPVPSAGQTTPNDACQCNHIAYSLMAACSWCQEGVYSDSWSTESDWSNGCTSYATSGVDSSVNATGINIPPYALQPNPGELHISLICPMSTC